MVGPTGCGKTEIARRLAKLCRAPFIKVEATKFTEVGYHGRDVDTIIKDLMDASLTLVKELKTEALAGEIGPAVEARILEALTGPGAAEDTVESFRALLRGGALDDREIAVDVPQKDARPPGGGAGGGGGDIDLAVTGVGGAASIDLGEFMQVRGGRRVDFVGDVARVRGKRWGLKGRALFAIEVGERQGRVSVWEGVVAGRRATGPANGSRGSCEDDR